jgi:hypothetical protein
VTIARHRPAERPRLRDVGDPTDGPVA